MFNWLFKSKNKNWLPPVVKKDGTKTRVFVGVSGGVDSSVSAAILKQKGYDVTGVFMKTYYPPELKCDWQAERLDAMRVCTHLNIPFLTCDLEKEYKEEVFDYMINSYKKGITPNPDIFCNKYVKFGRFLKWATENCADYIATGHYAQHFYDNERASLSAASHTQSMYHKYISFVCSLLPRISSHYRKNSTMKISFHSEQFGSFDEEDFTHHLGMGLDQNKDQTYFLYQLTQEKLQKALFPIGHLPKAKVRKLAKKFGLFTANKKDSQGLCFVGPVNMKDFLGTYIQEKPGNVLNEEGEVIGTHDGAFFLTIGQRHGFVISPKHKTPEMPKLFVLSKNIKDNTVTVGPKTESSIEKNNKITISEVNWVGGAPKQGEEIQSRIRHRGQLKECTLQKIENGQYIFTFETPHADVAYGQSLVLYKNNVCLGGGIIVDSKE